MSGVFHGKITMRTSAEVLGNEVEPWYSEDPGSSNRGFAIEEKEPNKAPEPTTMAVTPRAVAGVIEMKPWNVNRIAARGAPATVVAHL